MVTRPYLNLLGKPRIFQVFRGKKFRPKNLILCILHKIIFFPEKKINKKNVCAYPTQLPEKLILLFGLMALEMLKM